MQTTSLHCDMLNRPIRLPSEQARRRIVDMRFLDWLLILTLGFSIPLARLDASESRPDIVRVATYNVSMYRDRAGQLADELERGDSRQARQIAEVLQRVRPDVVLLNEFDYEQNGTRAVSAFRTQYLQKSQQGLSPLAFPHYFYEPVNTGVDSGLDLDGDGQLGGPADAWGYGRYPGQYGMLLLSRLPIDREKSSAYQHLLWADMPSPTWPRYPSSGEHFYNAAQRNILRLPSKSFWDVAIKLQHAETDNTLHLLCSHPTPPGFDGPEDRNGCRNYDEIGMIARHITDRVKRPFVVLGDLNSDPQDGGSRPGAMQQLFDLPAVNSNIVPRSEGAVVASRRRPEVNQSHRSDPAHDTAEFGGSGHGNLRVDYVLPSKQLEVVGSGVYWPKPGEPGSEAIKASDHRLVWIDIRLPTGE
ncbi:MAG: endonuclease/exonuclease/phosphatase family protein [Planctomycetota bacterium]